MDGNFSETQLLPIIFAAQAEAYRAGQEEMRARMDKVPCRCFKGILGRRRAYHRLDCPVVRIRALPVFSKEKS